MNAFALVLALVTAPPIEFPKEATWLNVKAPLTLQSLKGRVVLLDFWTYCCINCMQIIPDLKFLEEKYASRGVVVIGVHSGKFDNEKDPENIRAAMARYEIKHPVVDDSEYKIWEAFDVKAWPTLVLLGSDGKVTRQLRGEGHRAELDALIAQALADGQARRDLIDKPIALSVAPPPKTPLAFPGKIIAANGHLFISDSNHNRVIEAEPSGKVLSVFEGFNKPQGLAVSGNTLFVADTEAHVVKAVELNSKQVTVIAGTGKKGRFLGGSSVDLASPWDVLALNGILYIANAGTHQLLGYDLAQKTIAVVAGSGRERRIDGDALQAALAQPSGLATDGTSVFFADSEVSSVRRYDPKTKTVETLVGEDLFEFGDIDGAFASARLQHPLGLAFANGTLYVADTYNHKVKQLDLAKRTISAVYGKQGLLFEPGGLAALAGKLFIADTNNSRVVVYDLAAKTAAPLVLTGLSN
jgi:thiol-disulfide isomerase/thioredoxin